MKSILKPGFLKAVLTVILIYISSALWRTYVISRISDTFPIGFPFQFYLAWGPCRPEETCSEFNWLFLIFDIGIWYFISALIVQWIKNRRRAM